MEFRTIVETNCATVFLEGRLAFGSYPEFRDATAPLLDLPAVKEIRLDLAGVDYLDSSALGMILHFNQKAGTAGKALTLARATPKIASILKVVNFNRLVTILP